MKFDCFALVQGTKYLGQVEAETAEEAEEKAASLDSAFVGLCHQCSSECEDPEITRITVDPAEQVS